MEWYRLAAIITAVLCVTVFLYRLLKLLKLGLPKDLSQKAGSVADGVIYSYTKAMSPFAKESAYLHMPTYMAGMIFHIAIFISIPVFFVCLYSREIIGTLPLWFDIVLISSITFGAVMGLSILFKRVINGELRFLSCADDYISNVITVLFVCFTALNLTELVEERYYFICSALFFLWLPFGKTKHALYFFFARLHLGFYYGRRGVWPSNGELKDED